MILILIFIFHINFQINFHFSYQLSNQLSYQFSFFTLTFKSIFLSISDILQHMFSVVTDTSHTAGLTMHATILAYVFALVESGKVNIILKYILAFK
ncbi:MAG: hypothetical protein GY694_22210 [Gammaproteobacteria bacterium]|nr:hypothetical protein [Gammaproteobacteria bacterium]